MSPSYERSSEISRISQHHPYQSKVFDPLPIQEILNNIENKLELRSARERFAPAGFRRTHLTEQENAVPPFLELR